MIIESKGGSVDADNFLETIFLGSVEGNEYSTMVLYKETLDEQIIKKCTLNTVDFLDCGLEGTVFDETIFNEAIFKLSDLKDATFSGCVLKNVRFIDCKMESVDFSNANMEGCEFIRCDGSIIAEDADMTDVQFTHCDFQDSNFCDTALFAVTLSGSNFDDTSFSGAYAMDIAFERTSLTGADLSWGAVHVYEIDRFSEDSRENTNTSSSDLRMLPSAYRATELICHNAVLITG
jgi:uncharacterized protein YjbI with pentapeptide repeats